MYCLCLQAFSLTVANASQNAAASSLDLPCIDKRMRVDQENDTRRIKATSQEHAGQYDGPTIEEFPCTFHESVVQVPVHEHSFDGPTVQEFSCTIQESIVQVPVHKRSFDGPTVEEYSCTIQESIVQVEEEPSFPVQEAHIPHDGPTVEEYSCTIQESIVQVKRIEAK